MFEARRCLVALIALLLAATPLAQSGSHDASKKSFDEVLDLYVRDGFVYYRALKLERAKLDSFVASLADVSASGSGDREQMAFWLNAYNALVLKTVVDHYPIAQRTSQYPAHSIRQIPGAFERLTHKIGGRTVTLDEIEKTVLPGFKDPRLFLALGRGAVGGGRLRSEAFSADRLEAQLKEVAEECVSRTECIQIDRGQNKVSISPIFSWREKDFVDAYASQSSSSFAERSPVERAVLAFVEPRLLTTERDFLEMNQFQVVFKAFDWTLNDLTGRGGR
jgi:hypothetical protein